MESSRRAGGQPVAEAGEPTEPEWSDLIGEVIADPERLTLVFQPIVGLEEATIAGYEALSRFAVPTGVTPESARALTPDRWFLAADRIGHGAEFEALVVARCLALRKSLPPNRFLTFNVSPHLVTEPEIADLLLGAGSLSPLVVEFTEHHDSPDLERLVAFRDELAERGGLLALDDAGSGYSGLQQMTRLRPHLIKLDRALVMDADRDEVKLALAELLGEFAARIDAWLLAEGVETWGELNAFARLGVPLIQGYLLGRPAPPWSELPADIVARLKLTVARVHLSEHAASLLEVTWIGTGENQDAPAGQFGLCVDEHNRPLAVLIPLEDADGSGPRHRQAPVSLRTALSEDIIALARRLLTRPVQTRFDPVICVDGSGQALGIIRVERLISRLAELKSGP
jgi:EAL domain-containing protein (putative c-di-GMP-specific phosphodiesterase class I)